MSDALETLRRELATSSRDHEHLVFDTSRWSDDDKREALAPLRDAVRKGDPRDPEALAFVVAGERWPPSWERRAAHCVAPCCLL
jgi:hypothetical protein